MSTKHKRSNNVRVSGPLHSSLARLGPFLFVAQQGTMGKTSGHGNEATHAGRFLIANAVGNGLVPYFGLILPLSQCTDQWAREGIFGLQKYLDTPKANNDLPGGKHPDRHLPEKRAAAQEYLTTIFGNSLILQERNALNGFIQFRHSPGLFPFLSGRFVYVNRFVEDAFGFAEATSFASFKWNSYGVFLEWFNAHASYNNWGWQHAHVFAVFDPPELFHFDFDAMRKIVRPVFDPSLFFVPAPGVEIAVLDCKITQEDYVGGATLYFCHGSYVVDVGLSDVSPPFEMLLEWLKMVSNADLPTRVEIDDEGMDKRLETYQTGDPQLILFRIQEPYDSDCEVHLECLVDRQQFVENLRIALRDFFIATFRADRWDAIDWEGDLLQNRMLSDPWLMHGAKHQTHRN